MTTPQADIHCVKASVAAVVLALSAILVAVGCQSARQGMPNSSSFFHMVRFDSAPTLRDPRWESISSHTMTLDAQRVAGGEQVREPGSFRLAYGNDALYLRIDFTDRDVVSTVTNDADKLFLAGDVAEWFIGTSPTVDGKPGSYYELHITPSSRRAAYRIDRPGLYEVCGTLTFTAEVAVTGTLNDHNDFDTGWSAMFTLPWEAVEQLDSSLPWNDRSPANLSFLVGRYNYGHHLTYDMTGKAGPELSMWPTQPKTAFHLRSHHAQMKVGKP